MEEDRLGFMDSPEYPFEIHACIVNPAFPTHTYDLTVVSTLSRFYLRGFRKETK